MRIIYTGKREHFTARNSKYRDLSKCQIPAETGLLKVAEPVAEIMRGGGKKMNSDQRTKKSIELVRIFCFYKIYIFPDTSEKFLKSSQVHENRI